MMVSLLPVPALLIRISAPPNACSVAATRVAVPSAVATSQGTPMARTPWRSPTVGSGLGEAGGIARGEDEVGAFRGQPVRHREPDADAAAGDDGDLVP